MLAPKLTTIMSEIQAISSETTTELQAIATETRATSQALNLAVLVALVVTLVSGGAALCAAQSRARAILSEFI